VDLANRATNASDLGALAAELAALLKSSSRPQSERPGPQRDRGERPNGNRIEEATKLQKLYREKRPRAMQQVLAGPSPHCQIDQEAVHAHFAGVYSFCEGNGVAPFEWPNWDGESEAVIGDALMQPFTPEEVNSRLKCTHNSAPGPDGVTYADVKRVDPGSRVITAVFNACLRAKSVPESWKSSNTVLVHKKGHKNDISNWRPLALGDSVPKLFAAVVADRLMAFAVNGNRLSHPQKGFLRHEGCHEHNFLLGQILEDSRRGGKDVVLGWLDLTNAFGSIPHRVIQDAVAGMGVPRAAQLLSAHPSYTHQLHYTESSARYGLRDWTLLYSICWTWS